MSEVQKDNKNYELTPSHVCEMSSSTTRSPFFQIQTPLQSIFSEALQKELAY